MGGGCTPTHTLSLYLPSRTKFQCTLQLRVQMHSPCFVSTPMYSVIKSMKNKCPRICGGFYSRCSNHPARRRVDLLLWETRSQASTCCGSGSGIRCLFDPWIREPGSGMGKKIRIQPRSYFREHRNHFLGLKYLNSLMRIRDPGW